MTYVVDTDVLIDVLRGYPPAVAWFSHLEALPLVPGFVIDELLQDAQTTGYARQARQLVAPLPVIWPSPAACGEALAAFRAYHLSHGLGYLDALVAACARALPAILCTCDANRYRAISDLECSHPYPD